MEPGVSGESVAASPAALTASTPQRSFASATRTSSTVFDWACVAAVALGLSLRALQLFANRGLSQDEATLALNVMHRSFTALFGQLDFQQAAPPGFLVIQKLITVTLGSGEFASRLFPFACGSIALVLMVPLAREAVNRSAVALAVALFALSDPLINWTAYDKQYAGDVLVSVAVLWLGLRLRDQPERRSTAVLFAALGAGAIWLSHASVFVLAGVSATLFSHWAIARKWHRAVAVSAISVPWLVSFGIFALTSSDNLVLLQTVLRGGPGAFAGSGSGLHSLRQSFGEFRYASGIPHFLQHGSLDAGLLVFALAGGFCSIGIVSLLRRNADRAAMLLTPLAFMLIAWGLGKYPLLGRTQLFLVPSFVLLLAEGITFAGISPRRASIRTASIVLAGAVALTFAAPALKHVFHPRKFEDMKPVLAYLARNQRPNDSVYVFYTAQYQLRYYLECGCAGGRFETERKSGLWPLRPAPGGPSAFAATMLSVPPRLLVSRDRDGDASKYVSDIESLRGRRVWFLLSAVDESETTQLLREFGKRGVRRASFSTGKGKSGAAVYLYDMTTNP